VKDEEKQRREEELRDPKQATVFNFTSLHQVSSSFPFALQL
jgi:hypothetical protein